MNEQPVKKDYTITKWFGKNLAELLASKIQSVHSDFASSEYIQAVAKKSEDLTYTQRIELHAELLKQFLPTKYKTAIQILMQILGEENPNETGMFKYYYWTMPIGKYIEKFGINDVHVSLDAIEEVTKRSTGEYAIRPFIRKYPETVVRRMNEWSRSSNFHLRRLSTEGLRPKLPWATKLDIFIENPQPVFDILDNLIEDDSKFVQKSVANNIRDYLKVNKKEGVKLIERYRNSHNKNTQWILKHAVRKIEL